MAAARRILEEEGREALTMRRLAAQVGMRAPSLYKHLPSKSQVELALIDDALVEIGAASHAALRQPEAGSPLRALLLVYRRYGLAHANLYRLATDGPLDRDALTPGLEEWAGNPWYVVTGEPQLAQALWSFAHGAVILELDRRYPPGSRLEDTWEAGVRAFVRAAQTAPPS